MGRGTLEHSVVYSRKGCKRKLGDKIGDGGEGSVYNVIPSQPSAVVKTPAVVKIFSKVVNKELRGKLELMICKRKHWKKASLQFGQCSDAWPQMLVFDDKKATKCIGYGMKRIIGHNLVRLQHSEHRKKYFPGVDRMLMTETMINLWQKVETLHNHEIYIGDINLSNILVQKTEKGTYEPHWIDCDSYQIERYKCLVGRDEYRPPEHKGKDYKDIARDAESDLFALAILTFQCMIGRHPYDAVGGGSVLENMDNNHFPYESQGIRPREIGAIPEGPWFNAWKGYPYKIKQLFIRTLGRIKKSKNGRATPKEWIKELNEYKRLMLDKPDFFGRELLPSRPPVARPFKPTT